jgi:hypothetical protein
MLNAHRVPAGGQHLHLHPPAALRAVPGRLEPARYDAGLVCAVGEWAAAAVTPTLHDSAVTALPTGP